ncbi:diguanylate cyclase DgcN [Atlantibacter hermannii]|uniref:diguanylate cyclase DgcN n=1 Tax=Atlantibacter hermannii TaxID=565 RepID=UPI0022B78D33|nr:diguanylate cyclase DgcN [Atlantibacter hermannii]MCZ7835694.1 diguanylate cyclase DgcN [Atlantibacter hermannii]
MTKDINSMPRPTFKRTLRRISMISVVITMIIAWLLLSVSSMLTLKQYAQNNLRLLSVSISHTLEAAMVFRDGPAAYDTLAALGGQRQFASAQVVDTNGEVIADWSGTPENDRDVMGGLVSKWVFPTPIVQPIYHNGKVLGEIRLTAMDNIITHFVWTSLGVLTACLILASCISLSITRYLHKGMVNALNNITEVAHDVQTNRNFSRRVSAERIEEFHRFGQDFNTLLDEMETWQTQLQRNNASLLISATHDPLTGLANRTAFRQAVETMMNDRSRKIDAALLFMDGDNFKYINDTWGHAAGDRVLIEAAQRLRNFSGETHSAYRLGGDEFAILLTGVHSTEEILMCITDLRQALLPPILLNNGETTALSMSIGYALAKCTATPEALMEIADKNMYHDKSKRRLAFG